MSIPADGAGRLQQRWALPWPGQPVARQVRQHGMKPPRGCGATTTATYGSGTPARTVAVCRQQQPPVRLGRRWRQGPPVLLGFPDPGAKQACVDGEVTGLARISRTRTPATSTIGPPRTRSTRPTRTVPSRLRWATRRLRRRPRTMPTIGRACRPTSTGTATRSRRRQDVDYATAIARINQDKVRLGSAGTWWAWLTPPTTLGGTRLPPRGMPSRPLSPSWRTRPSACFGGQRTRFPSSARRRTGPRMGNLALDNNKFIRRCRPARVISSRSTSCSAPWPRIGTPSPLAAPGDGCGACPADVMGAYKPVTAPVDFRRAAPANAAAGNVGKATGSLHPEGQPVHSARQ